VLKNTSKIADYERVISQNNALELINNLVPKVTK